MESTKPQTEYSNSKLNEFLEKQIDPKALAKIFRRTAYILALTVIRNDENKNPIDQDWADDGFFWLNEFAEIIDPVLEKQE